METPETYSHSIADLQHAKTHARSNDEQVKDDKALCQIVTAANHAKLVDRLMVMADGERQQAIFLASVMRERQAHEALARADQYEKAAEKHREAAEECQKKGEELVGNPGPKPPSRRPRNRTPAAIPASPVASK